MTETAADRDGGHEGVALDVVGVGALNLDFIATVAAMPAGTETASIRSRLERLAASSSPPFEWGAETVVDEKTIYAALEEVSTTSLDATLGGSAFNAVFALTQMQLGLRLGFVGVAGRVPIPGLSSLAQFVRLGVDHAFVATTTPEPAGYASRWPTVVTARCSPIRVRTPAWRTSSRPSSMRWFNTWPPPGSST
jgi:hypothetical protein